MGVHHHLLLFRASCLEVGRPFHEVDHHETEVHPILRDAGLWVRVHQNLHGLSWEDQSHWVPVPWDHLHQSHVPSF